VLEDDSFVERIQLLERFLKPPHFTRQPINPTQQRKIIRKEKLSQQRLRLVQQNLQPAPPLSLPDNFLLVLADVLFPERDYAYQRARERHEHFGQVHDGARGFALRELPKHLRNLVFSNGAKGLDAVGAEEVDDAEFLQFPPAWAVGREAQVEPVVRELSEAHEGGPGCEVEVVGFEDFFGDSGGGNDDGLYGSETQRHERAVALGELP